MRVLVCGSEGRLMSATIKFLLRAGYDVTGVDTCQKWGLLDAPRQYRFVRADCSDATALRPLLQGIEGVIQAAATLYGVVGFHAHGADILGRDLAAHENVLRLSQETGVRRVVYVSSSIVYEQCQSEPEREEDGDWPPIPRTDYGLSKVVGERLSKAYWRQYGLPYTLWRPFNVIDPDETGTDNPGIRHVFADLIHRLVVRKQNPVEILGDGNQVRSFVHIREVAQAIAQFSFDPRTMNQTYNLGSPETVTVKELAQSIFEKARARSFIRDPRPLSFVPLPVAETDVKRRVGCFAKAERELDWKATISLDQALEECLDALLARPELGAAHLNLRTGGTSPQAASAPQ